MTALASHDLRFTAAEFERIARAGGFLDARIELLDGEIIKMSPVHAPHADVHSALYLSLVQALAANGASLVARFEISVDLSEYSQPLPDIVVWDGAAGRLKGAVPRDLVRLIIEISDSTLTNDLGDKLQAYARAGVPEYWVADVNRQRLLLHAQPDGDTYERRETYPFGDTVTALTLPLTLDTSSLIEA